MPLQKSAVKLELTGLEEEAVIQSSRQRLLRFFRYHDLGFCLPLLVWEAMTIHSVRGSVPQGESLLMGKRVERGQTRRMFAFNRFYLL